MIHLVDTFPTPFGLFSTAVDEQGTLVATAFGSREALRQRSPFGDLMDDKTVNRPVREQVLAYCAGERREFTLSLSPRGTPFQQKVWWALRRVPFGETRSYGQLAANVENPAASRAVGRANAANPICLIVPCHRVIGADGSLTGFAFGEEIKRRLLDHERVLSIRSCAA